MLTFGTIRRICPAYFVAEMAGFLISLYNSGCMKRIEQPEMHEDVMLDATTIYYKNRASAGFYPFYGSANAMVAPINKEFKKVLNPYRLYDLLSDLWSVDTCAPRMRKDWNKENKTLGQCSITSFLVQDIFGGEVYGVPLGDGNFHCFNKVGDKVFDLTSEQFLPKVLEYTLEYPQTREAHFLKEEKRLRYEALKALLLQSIRE